jgi:hypothetical protein
MGATPRPCISIITGCRSRASSLESRGTPPDHEATVDHQQKGLIKNAEPEPEGREDLQRRADAVEVGILSPTPCGY